MPFILAAYYTAVGFYAAHYQFSPIWAGVKNLVLCGVFIGLAVASGASNIIVLAGIPVIWGLSLYKLNAEYKKAYDSAKGLDKEKVYSSQRKKIATCVWALPLSFIVLPVLALLLFYAITYKPITAVYGEFFGGIINDMGKSFIASGSLSRLGVLIGYGSEKANGAYKLINYIPYSLALVGLILTTAVAAFYKAEALKGIWQGIRNKYKIITVMAIFSYLPLLIGINLSVCGIAAFSCAYIAYIILGVVAIEKMLGKNLFKGLAIAISVISFITFAGCFFGSFGFEISDTLKNVFYMWQV